jgi:hypothetical protein
MKVRGNKKLYWLAVPPLTLGALGLSVAGANWLNSGSGTAGVSTENLTADSVSGTGSGLYPGATVPVTVTVTDKNSYAEQLISITGGQASGTNGADVSIAGATYAAGTQIVPANGSITVTLQATMVAQPAGNPGDTYSVPLTASLGPKS